MSQGTPEIVLVSGYSGVGKSSVVNELHKVLACSQQPLYAFDSGYVRSKADGPRKLSEMGIAGESGGAKTINVNLYSILGSPTIYKLVQKAVGAEKPRQYCLSRFAAVEPGNRVIDIGSGPGLAVGYLPQVDYIGFEPSERYVQHARRKYANTAKFIQGYFNRAAAEEFKPYDLVLLFGVLHHCDDGTVARMLTDIAVGLSPRGRVLTVDPCLTATQSAWARRVALYDRGNYVRTPEQYTALASPHLRVAKCETVDGLLYIPTTVHLAALEHG